MIFKLMEEKARYAESS